MTNPKMPMARRGILILKINSKSPKNVLLEAWKGLHEGAACVHVLHLGYASVSC